MNRCSKGLIFKNLMKSTRQNGECQNGCFTAYQGVRNVRFCGKFGVLCFLETPVFRFALCLITDDYFNFNEIM